MTATEHSATTIRDALVSGENTLAAHSDSARLDAELLLAVAVKHDRAWLYANAGDPLPARAQIVFEAMLAQRAEGRPVAHLTGQREFWSLELEVNAYTLVPRPETELLVEQALKRLPGDGLSTLLDLGTGSGAIAIALAKELPRLQVCAVDKSADALDLARSNAERHDCNRIEFFCGDWFAPLPAQRFDVVVSNPPYVGTNETELTDKELAFEPVEALYSGPDGLDAITHIVNNIQNWLQPGGWLLLEHGFRQQEAVHNLLTSAGLASIQTYRDLSGQPRVTEAQYGKE